MDAITNTLKAMDAITQKRQRLETESNAPRYDSRATLETCVIARESFVTVGSHGIDCDTQRIMLHLN